VFLRAVCPVVASLVSIVLALPVDAGHEIPFYPSFYPQEITVLAASPQAAGRLFEKKTLHAYTGPDPFRARPSGAAPGGDGTPTSLVTERVASLEGYVVLGFQGGGLDADGRCAAGWRTARALARVRGEWVIHPYPVTPYHPDFARHFDLVEAARKHLRAVEGDHGSPLRVRASGRAAQVARAAGLRVVETGGEATLEEVSLRDLLGPGPWPPWARSGWFQALLVQSRRSGDRPVSAALADTLERRLHGSWATDGERVGLERRLVGLSGAECDRLVVGYTTHRDVLNGEYSEGIENAGWDAQTGVSSAIFVRTVKLKDFPWNGWLTVAADSRPTSAWNPVDGFGDSFGRLVWAALGDPALLPTPRGEGWAANRVRAVETRIGSVDVPADAVRPDPATGTLRAVGPGTTARAKLVYRVAASAFHDGTKMSPADAVYPYAFVLAPVRGGTRDPAVERAATVLAEWLAAFRIVRTDSEIRDLGETQLVYDVPVIEVYLKHAGAAGELEAVAPPWSAVPWQLLTLLDEASRRGIGALSEADARRRGVPWLDLARDRKAREALLALAEQLERRSWVPEPLRGLVTVEQARQRWAALRRFGGKHGHLLVTNGPYRLETWGQDRAVLGVFRDLTYPLGVGAFDRFAVPLRAFVTGVERQGDRLVLQADVERVERAARASRIVREAFRREGEKRDGAPVVHYTVVSGSGEVAAAGVSEELDGSRPVVDLQGRLRPGDYRVIVALALDGNLVDPEPRVIPYRVTE
jgi:hypothetical protein